MAQNRIDELMASAGLPVHSKRVYCQALAYWQAWHQLRFGTPLPLASPEIGPVGPDIVDQFVDDHCAMAIENQLRMRMPPVLDQGLRERGFNKGVSCIAPRTLYVRVEALKYGHRLAELPFDRRAAFRRRREVFSLWEAERAGLGVPTATPMSIEAALDVMLRVCGADRDGRRDAALIMLATRLSVPQIRGLCCGDVVVGWKAPDGHRHLVASVRIRQPQGLLQEAADVGYWDEDAIPVRDWIELRRTDGAAENAPLFPGRVTNKARFDPPRSVTANWINERFTSLSQRAGVGHVGGRSAASPFALRKAFEHHFRDYSMLVDVARVTGLSLAGARRYRRKGYETS